MAFVTANPLASWAASNALKSSFTTPTRPLRDPRSKPSNLRMGYGSYSIINDKTKGHINKNYGDMSRYSLGVPATPSLDDAIIGRDNKGRVFVPQQGIPQQFDEALGSRDHTAPPDPRLAEAEGTLYDWDPAYVDPKFSPDTFANISDEEVSDDAFMKFRSSCSAERGAVLTAMDFRALARRERYKNGFDVNTLLTLQGSLEATFCRLQKISNPIGFTPTGEPQSEIPGQDFTASVGALDFQTQPNETIAFWKTPASGIQNKRAIQFKKPSGSDTPDLPYNANPSYDQMKDTQNAQTGRAILPPRQS